MLQRLPSHARRLMAVLSLLFCASGIALPDVIERPSAVSARAASSLMLAVGRAGKRLVAVGERGIVLLSDDNGNAWRQVQSPVSVSLTSVRFSDETTGWITGHGGVLLQTRDGGQSWEKRLDGIELGALILKSEQARKPKPDREKVVDAQRLVADGPDKPLLDTCFVSKQVGFTVGAYGLILRTDDGGKTWQPWQDRLPNLRGRHLNRIAFLHGDLFIVGEQGSAYVSEDSGATFKALASPYRGSYFGVTADTPDSVVIFGLRGNAFRVSRHGTVWGKLESPTPATFVAATQASSGQAILASQTGELFRTAAPGRLLAIGPSANRALITALVEADDGSLVAAGRGMARLPREGGAL